MLEDRLLHLADELDKSDTREDFKFDFNGWRYENPYFFCGTIGCAMGLATMLPEFQQLGLSFGSYGSPKFNGKTSHDAIAAFFDITFAQSRCLFDPTYSGLGFKATAKQVAQHIRQFVYSQREPL